MTSAPATRTRRPHAYAPALDGLRGVFVMGFIAYHFGVHVLGGMWLAINFFFVISGFFITRLLLVEHIRTGRIEVLRFYRRRMRRLFPALFALLVLVTAYGIWFAPSGMKRAIGGDVLATLGYVMNWRLIAEQDPYFFTPEIPSLLRHAWTLAIEEQFYLLAPFLVLLLVRTVRTHRGRLLAIGGVVVLLTGWTAWVGFDELGDLPRLYYGTDTRVVAILLGAMLGVASLRTAPVRRRPPGVQVRPDPAPRGMSRRARVLAGGFAALGLPGLLVNAYTPWMWNWGGQTFITACSLGVVALCADPVPGLLSRVFSWRPFVWLGVRTYGLYLWHWPVAVASQVWPVTNPVASGILGLALTVVIADLSHRFIELPGMRDGVRAFLPRLRSRSRASSRSSATLAGFAIPAILAGLAVTALLPHPAQAEQRTFTLPDGRSYTPSTERAPVDLFPGQAGYTGTPTRIAVYGDSIGHYLVSRFPTPAFAGVHLTDVSRAGCDLLDAPIHYGPSLVFANDPLCLDLKRSWATRVAVDRAEVLLLVASPLWVVPHGLPSGVVGIGDPAGAATLRQALDRLYAAALEAGVRQVQVLNAPCRDAQISDLPPELRGVVDLPPDVVADIADPARLNALIADWAAGKDRVAVLDLYAVQCPGGQAQYSPAGIPLTEDVLHYSPQATPPLWSWLLGQSTLAWARLTP